MLSSVYATGQQLIWNDATGLALDPAISWRVQAGVDALSDSLRARSRVVDEVYVPPVQPVRLAR